MIKTKHLAATVTLISALAAHATPYELQVEVGYGFGGTSSSGAYSGNPDTGFVIVKNTGTSAFTGEVSLLALFNGGNRNDTSGNTTLNPGDSWVLLPGSESSNDGGFNKNQAGQDPNLAPDDGVKLSIVGSAGGNPINFSIFDKDIHSGTLAVNPFGVTLDNYILQGGDPFGRDTGDNYEVSQAHAFLTLSGPTGVPDTGSSLALLGGALTSLVLWRRRSVA